MPIPMIVFWTSVEADSQRGGLTEHVSSGEDTAVDVVTTTRRGGAKVVGADERELERIEGYRDNGSALVRGAKGTCGTLCVGGRRQRDLRVDRTRRSLRCSGVDDGTAATDPEVALVETVALECARRDRAEGGKEERG